MRRTRTVVHPSSSFRSSIERALIALYRHKRDLDELIRGLESHPARVRSARALHTRPIELSAQLRTIHLNRIRDCGEPSNGFSVDYQ